MSRKKLSLSLLAAVFTTGALFVGGMVAVNALGSSGVDSSDTNFSKPVGYISARSADVNVMVSTFEIYYPTNTGTKTVDIIDGDFCRTNSNGTGGKGANGIRDMGFASIGTGANSGATVTTYTFSSSRGINTTSQGIFRNSATADCDAASVSFPGSLLDSTTVRGRTFYKLNLRVEGNAGFRFQFINWYRLRSNTAGSFIAYAEGRQYAIDAEGKQSPTDAYYRLDIPVAPECTANATAHFTVTDPDNSNPVIQPSPWSFQLIDQTTGNTVQLRNRTGMGSGTYNNSTNTLTPPGGSKTDLTFDADLIATHNYVWRHSRVYDNNTIIFKIDNAKPINSVVTCPPTTGWRLTGTSSNAKLPTPPDTYRFTHRITNTGPNTSTTFTYQIQQGTSRTGTFTPVICEGTTTTHLASALANGGTLTKTCDRVVLPGATLCQKIVWWPQSSTNVAADSSEPSCVTAPVPNVTVECSDILTTVANPDSATPFGIRLGAISTGPTRPTSVDIDGDYSGPGKSGTFDGDDIAPTGPGGNIYILTVNGIGPTSAGRYDVSWTITFTGGSQRCSDTFVVADKPYLAIYGGDAMAGVSEIASGGCTTNANAGFLTWNKGSTEYSGAGTQFAAMALGEIRGFASALNANPGGNPSKPQGLAFANTGSLVSLGTGLFGGRFGGPSGSSFLDNASCNLISGTPTITNAADLPTLVTDDQFMLVTNQDVPINDNISYSDDTSWTEIADIPNFKLVVVGHNIIIDGGVDNLDGLYVAIPDSSGNGGMIFTCDVTGDPATDSSLYNKCNRQLVINGAFVAKQVRFLRTHGTLGAAGLGGANELNAAEVFHYGPEMWLPRNRNLTIDYKAMTGLPPVL